MPVTIKYYELTYNSDQTEGRGPDVVHARFTDKSAAIAVCNDERFWKKFGVMGTRLDPKYHVREVVAPLFESAPDYFAYDVEEVKRKALAKLTDAEKKALGLPV